MTFERGDQKVLMSDWTRYLPERFRAPVVPVVRLSGTIGAVTPLRPGLTLAGVSKTLDKAFETKPGDGMWLDPEDRVVIW